VKIRLRGASKPPVWRRLLVPAEIRLDRFHDVIQVAMGWTDTHMHSSPRTSPSTGSLIPSSGSAMSAWHGSISSSPPRATGFATRTTSATTGSTTSCREAPSRERRRPNPVCLAGKGACPPEDCGGVWGYADLREAIANPAHDEHEDILEWLGLDTAADFDPAAFDIADTNKALDQIATAQH
jgi:Plasmid pRiA4b ORF-3-like protein